MIVVEMPFTVERPIHLVFQRISNIADYRRWAPAESGFFLGNEITSEGPFGVGTTYKDKLKWRGEAVGEVVAYSPPYNVEFRQTTSFGVKVFSAVAKYTLKAAQNSTEVVHRFEAKPFGIFKLLEPVLSVIIRSERERTCKAVKRSLEQEKQVPA